MSCCVAVKYRTARDSFENCSLNIVAETCAPAKLTNNFTGIRSIEMQAQQLIQSAAIQPAADSRH
jgi:hypothetical protein